MTRDDIIKMAREAGLSNDFGHLGYPYLPELERFAVLVAAAEREACAKVCDAVQQQNEDDGAWLWEAKNCAIAIRARGEK